MRLGELVLYKNKYYVYADELETKPDEYTHKLQRVNDDPVKDIIYLDSLDDVKIVELKIGDKVRIVDNNKSFIDVKYNSDMDKFIGRILEIGFISTYPLGCQVLYHLCYPSTGESIAFTFSSAWFVPANSIMINNDNFESDNSLLLNKIYKALGKD